MSGEETNVDTTATEETVDYSAMSEEEIATLPEEKFRQFMSETEADETEEESVEEESEETSDTETVAEETTEKSFDEKIDDGDDLTPEELESATPEQRGKWYSLQKQREKNRAMESELEKERALREEQAKLIQQMRNKDEKPQVTYSSEYEKVTAQIDAKAEAYEEEYGEKYVPNWEDQKALDNAKQVDAQTNAERQRVSNFQRSIEQSESALKGQEGYEDYDTVYSRFIAPMLDQRNPMATANAQILFNVVAQGQDPAKFAYEVMAKQTEEGRNYFANKSNNTKVIAESKKQTTKTSAHTTGARPSNGGKQKVTISMLNKNFDAWYSQLSDKQLDDIALNGEAWI